MEKESTFSSAETGMATHSKSRTSANFLSIADFGIVGNIDSDITNLLQVILTAL
jgi:hypothetical protein